MNACFGSDGNMKLVFGLVFAILLLFGVVLLALQFGKKPGKLKRTADRAEQKETEQERLDTEKLDRILEVLKEQTRCDVVCIHTVPFESIGIAESKLGGYPYWRADMAYPRDAAGKPLYLLAQLDLSEVRDARLPDHGLLQFFVASDEFCGANFEEPDDNRGFRVVYHENVDPAVTEESVKELGIKATMDAAANGDRFLPLETQEKIIFEHVTECVSESSCEFDTLMGRALRIACGEELIGNSAWKTFNDTEFEYLTKDLGGWGHKMFGYPQFTQGDIRDYDGEAPCFYDTLLLQVDSEGGIMWGDCGIANFFIHGDDLARRDFSKVLFTWDCC